MLAYYAHPVSIYNTPQEERDIQLLTDLGFEVLNPNTPEHSEGYKMGGMDYFESIISKCDLVAFRAFPDGSVPAGVAREIEWSDKVIELPSCVYGRTMDVSETREFLSESGAR